MSTSAKKFWDSCRFSRLPNDYRTKNDELRFLSEQETSHRKQTTETKEKKSCHSIWLLTTSPTTSTRPL